jgi:hypothetical protein
VEADFFHSWADYLHGFPIAWFEPILNCSELEACGTPGLVGEIPKVIEARSHEIQRFRNHPYII